MSAPVYVQFAAGQLVRDRCGRLHRVVCQRGCQVWVSGGDWIHPSNLVAVSK